jgi:hypothetical protein
MITLSYLRRQFAYNTPPLSNHVLDILTLGSSLQVTRSNTKLDVALVHHNLTTLELSPTEKERCYMGIELKAAGPAKRPIPTTVNRSLPDPVPSTLVNLVPEPLLTRFPPTLLRP